MNDSRPNRRLIQAEQTKNIIISKVLELLQTKTFDQISIPSLCKSINISVGAFYHHFSSKEEIIYTVFTYIEEILTKEKNADTLYDEDYKAHIVNHLAFNLDYYIDTYGLSLLTHTVAALVHSRGHYFFDVNRLTATIMIPLLNEAQKKGIIDNDVNLKSVIEKIFTIYTGIIVALCIHGKNYDYKKEIKTLLYPYLESLSAKSF